MGLMSFKPIGFVRIESNFFNIKKGSAHQLKVFMTQLGFDLVVEEDSCEAYFSSDKKYPDEEQLDYFMFIYKEGEDNEKEQKSYKELAYKEVNKGFNNRFSFQDVIASFLEEGSQCIYRQIESTNSGSVYGFSELITPKGLTYIQDIASIRSIADDIKLSEKDLDAYKFKKVMNVISEVNKLNPIINMFQLHFNEDQDIKLLKREINEKVEKFVASKYDILSKIFKGVHHE
jgi:hypothetical protein